MHAPDCGERKLTELDFARLNKLVAAQAMPQLADVLDEAEVVPARSIPADVVTMNAQFVTRDLKQQRRQVLTLCYPAEAAPAKGFISVLSPAGTSLLGLQAGAIARWKTPTGEEAEAEIEGILSQPEARGDDASR
jgi:regulator of nucleoside diphosphate kinase